jgi:ABC-2 type transport system permease protein
VRPGLWTLVGVEIRKARAQKMTFVALLLPALYAFLAGGGMRLLEGAQRVRGRPAAPGNGHLCLATAATQALFFGLLFLIQIAALSIAGEVSSGTMKTLVTRPFRRERIVAAKGLSLLGLLLALVLLVGGAAWLSGRVFYGYAEITDRVFKDYVIHSKGRMDAEALRAFLLALLPMASTALFALLISAVAPGPGAAVGRAFGGFLALLLAKGFSRTLQLYLFSAYAPTLLDTSYFRELKGFAEGLSDAGWPDRTTILAVAVPLGSLAVFWSAAALVFRRKKIL